MSRLTAFLRRHFPRPPSMALSQDADGLLRGVLSTQPRNGVFLDLGANVGNVTAVALDYGHKVYAFEPDPQARRTLLARFADNPRVEIIGKAVGGTARMARFYTRQGTDTQSSSLIRQDGHAGNVYDIEVVDIVEFIRSLPAPPIVVKVDIEGAEVECLNAMIDAGVHKDIGLILVETHERFSDVLAGETEALRARCRNITNINLDWV